MKSTNTQSKPIFLVGALCAEKEQNISAEKIKSQFAQYIAKRNIKNMLI